MYRVQYEHVVLCAYSDYAIALCMPRLDHARATRDRLFSTHVDMPTRVRARTRRDAMRDAAMRARVTSRARERKDAARDDGRRASRAIAREKPQGTIVRGGHAALDRSLGVERGRNP